MTALLIAIVLNFTPWASITFANHLDYEVHALWSFVLTLCASTPVILMAVGQRDHVWISHWLVLLGAVAFFVGLIIHG